MKLEDLYAALVDANEAGDTAKGRRIILAIRRHPEYRARTVRPAIATRRNSR